MLVMRAFSFVQLTRLCRYMRALLCVLDHEQFPLCPCSGDGFSDVLAACGSRVLIVGGSFAGFCVAFAMRNRSW